MLVPDEEAVGVKSLQLPDALQIAGAPVGGCQTFLTNDTTLKRVTEINVDVLESYDEEGGLSEQASFYYRDSVSRIDVYAVIDEDKTTRSQYFRHDYESRRQNVWRSGSDGVAFTV